MFRKESVGKPKFRSLEKDVSPLGSKNSKTKREGKFAEVFLHVGNFQFSHAFFTLKQLPQLTKAERV
jgi:hypothetical protein